MVCFRYIIVNILYKGDNKDDDDDNNNNNNNLNVIKRDNSKMCIMVLNIVLFQKLRKSL